jgi:hypothetical protein
VDWPRTRRELLDDRCARSGPARGDRAPACLIERARQWAFEQVGERNDQVIDRGTPLIEDPAPLHPPLVHPGQGPARAVGVDETAFCGPP